MGPLTAKFAPLLLCRGGQLRGPTRREFRQALVFSPVLVTQENRS